MKKLNFCIFLCTKINFEAYLTLFPKLSEAPYPPRVLQNGSKKALRHVGSGLKGVEKLQFWLGFEPQIFLETKKIEYEYQKNIMNSKKVL